MIKLQSTRKRELADPADLLAVSGFVNFSNSLKATETKSHAENNPSNA